MKTCLYRIFLFFGLLAFTCDAVISQTGNIANLTIVNLERGEKLVQRSAEILKEEIEKRSSIKIATANSLPRTVQNSVILCLEKSVPSPYMAQISAMEAIGKEGFKLFKPAGTNVVLVVGACPRGVLYGVGKLLRMMEIRQAGIVLPEPLKLATTPVSTLRGHQIGFRPKTNAYDAWTVEQMDTYFRDMAIFGANAVEIMPDNTDDDHTGPLLKLSLLDMAIEQARICDEYGLDVWMWYPNMGKDYTSAEGIKAELEERRNVFSKVSRLDEVFVPGGDPGDLEPDILFNFLHRMAGVLHEYHPKAKIWVSPQVFRPTKEWLDRFYFHVNQKYSWFGGIVFGPWVKDSPEVMRTRVDASIPIRNYPDITHSLASQYPVPYWDLAFIRTLGRECINPRPIDQKAIHNHLAPFVVGSISYSEGINDDVNKMIWSDQDWDPTTPVINTLRDYARFFINPDFTEEIAQGILALEQNFKGNLLTNTNVTRTYLQWKDMEERLPKKDVLNYRFQLGLIRACYDEYIYRRLIHERAMESNALAFLSVAKEKGSQAAISSARRQLMTKADSDYMKMLRQKCFDLADSLFVNIGAQLTVEKHFAKSGRGNFMDYIDAPLNNAPWLLEQMEQITALGNEQDRLTRIHQLINRTNPGPGGFYDNFGTFEGRKRLVNKIPYEDDPGFLRSPAPDVAILRKNVEWVHVITARGFDNQMCPEEWMTQYASFYENPLEVQYDDLCVHSSYRVRVSYTGRYRSNMKLFANGYLVHDFIRAGEQPTFEFKIPQEAISNYNGTVIFRWETVEAERGSQVAELWIIKD